MAIEFNDIEDLIGKVLSGEANAEEQRYVESWRHASLENQKYFDDLTLIFQRAATNEVKVDFDTDAAWKKVRSQIARKTGKAVPLPTTTAPFWTPIRLAAGIVLVITSAIFTWRYYSAGEVQLANAATENQVLEQTLPDGSTAFLNKKSSISYEYNPREKTRKVKLKGEGFFNVKHEETKPFVIEAEEALVRDIGTAFNLKSYPGKDTIEVVVQSGIVQFYTLENPGLTVYEGETGLYSKSTKTFFKLEKADTNVLAYKTKVFSFHATDLRSVITQINEVYDSKIKLANDDIANCQLTVTFRNDELDTVVEVIAETLDLNVVRNDKDEIILNGPGCR